MQTNPNLFFWQPDAKITFQSQMLHFWQSQSTLFKNGQKKCPKTKTQNTFWITFSFLNNKFPKLLKEIYSDFLSITTALAIFLIIFVFFS